MNNGENKRNVFRGVGKFSFKSFLHIPALKIIEVSISIAATTKTTKKFTKIHQLFIHIHASFIFNYANWREYFHLKKHRHLIRATWIRRNLWSNKNFLDSDTIFAEKIYVAKKRFIFFEHAIIFITFNMDWWYHVIFDSKFMANIFRVSTLLIFITLYEIIYWTNYTCK